MKIRIITALTATTLLLTACQTMEGLQHDLGSLGSSISEALPTKNAVTAANVGENCPPLSIDPQLDEAVEFYEMDKPSEKTKISEFSIIGAQSECTLDAEYINMRVDLSFAGELGPKARRRDIDKPFFAYPYFVSVKDAEGTELAREIFSASVTYENGQQDVKLVETIKQRLPLNDDGSLPDYQVQVGLQLTEDQLFYNASQE